MKIVIDIPEEYYNAIKVIPDIQCTADMLIIKNGTPLPKGHGRLIDYDWVVAEYDKAYNSGESLGAIVDNAPTIIEADRGDDHG